MENGSSAGGSGAKAWLDQAWADWIRPLGVLIIAAAAYGAYHFDLVSERVAGIGLVLTVVLGLTGLGAIPALGLARKGSQRTTILLFSLLAIAGAGYPTLRIALAPAPLATGRLTAGALKQTLDVGADGPYELIVSGHFKQGGSADADAGYLLKVEGVGEQEVSGDIKRATHRYRVGRRGGMASSLEEQTEVVHRLDAVGGSKLTISTDNVDDLLENGLELAVRKAGPKPMIFWLVVGLAVLLGLVLDTSLVVEVREEDRKTRGPKREQSYLTVVGAMLLVFSINFPMDATSATLVRSAIGAFVLSVLLGAPSGWIVAAFARIATRPRRKS